MPVCYAFTFVHCTAFYSPAKEALINNNNNNNNCMGRLLCIAGSTLKLGFHIRGKRKLYALCVIRQKWKSM